MAKRLQHQLMMIVMEAVILLMMMMAVCPTAANYLPLSTDSADLSSASVDFGLMSREEPNGVFRPNSADDVSRFMKMAYDSPHGFPVSARGHGHSINGQAAARQGVVIEMLRRTPNVAGPPKPKVYVKESYVDAWGGELWADVLKSTLRYGLAPKSWTDYLHLTVGGTLSNAGISGQAFNYGPQVSNVFELDVVTGRGEKITCSMKNNTELFYGVLGGLGQFGIITRARIALEPAPQRTRWIRVLYSNFTAFTSDQEMLISLQGKPSSERFDYVEGFVIADHGLINNWRSSFFSPQNPVKISSFAHSPTTVLYCLEVTKNYFNSTPNATVNQQVDALMKKLHFIKSTVFTTDVGYVDFLDRVHKAELEMQAKGLWEVPHPWLNLFIPKSRIADFDRGVFKGILKHNRTSGPILVYPMNRNKWDSRSSVPTPNEEVFYSVSLLRSALEKGVGTQKLQYLLAQNNRVLNFCRRENIQYKQYLPYYTNQAEWASHFGDKWARFYRLKKRYDPKQILSTGQRIFTSPALGAFSPNDVAWS